MEDLILSMIVQADRGYTSPCWLWTGRKSKGGYGGICIRGKEWRAHRLSYTVFVGEIPQGLVLDHLCRVHECVNPAHLEAVTNEENIARGNWNDRYGDWAIAKQQAARETRELDKARKAKVDAEAAKRKIRIMQHLEEMASRMK